MFLKYLSATVRVAAQLVLTAVVAANSSAQTLTAVPFPATKETSITDCFTPTILNLPGGQTVTLRGGQFIHYHDANFDGTMYATNSSSGCTRMPPPSPGWTQPVITVTFLKPATAVTINAYNYAGDDEYLGWYTYGHYPDQPLSSSTAWFPSLSTLDSFPSPVYMFPGDPPLQALLFFPIGTTMQSHYTFDPPDWAFGLTGLLIPQGQPDIVKFDYGATGDDGKILISKADSDSYASKYQAAPGQVTLSGTLLDGTTQKPKQGTVYLRVDDPPDTAPYRGGDAHADDNGGQRAQLDGEQNQIATVTTDTDGTFKTKLTIKADANGHFVAGDNYQISGSTDSQMNCPGTCVKSGVFTLWKRVYVEEEHMFRQGSFLNDVAPAGGHEIPIVDPTPFQNLGSGATLELVHADSGGGEGFYFDFVTFRAVTQTSTGLWTIQTDPGPASTLARDYGTRPSTSASWVTDIKRDAVGIVGSGMFEPDRSYMSSLFNSTYVDLAQVPQAITEVPYVAEITNEQRTYFASNWLQQGTAANAYLRVAGPNVLHRVAGAQAPMVNTGHGWGAELGVTGVGGGTNNSFILVKRIEDLVAGSVVSPTGAPIGPEYSGLDPIVVNGEVTAHETVHFWVHQPAGSDGHGHCLEVSYRDPNLNCLMHEPYSGAGLADGLVDLHYLQHGADSEYMTIRRAADPVPQQ
jgi:hypothetical protein